MEPGFNTPRISPEQAPSLPPVSPELMPPGVQYETGPASPERESVPHFSTGLVEDGAAAPAIPVLPQPVVAEPSDDTATLLTSVPDVAADDDLIEKEWVDKAKKIIAETSDDPYRREQAVGQLQREYLRKRYGKEIGVSE